MHLLSVDANAARPLSILCLGAHPDDIEIGVGATLLKWRAAARPLSVHWCVFSGDGARAEEAQGSAMAWLSGAASVTFEGHGFPDAHFPANIGELKKAFEDLRSRVDPQIVFTHRRDDAHQDHRTVSELTWGAFRNHLILEYEIPKWDGDLGQPNCYSAVDADILDRKIGLLDRHFATQRAKPWFDGETFRGLARLRGMECRAQYAEAFVARKFALQI